MLNLVNLIKSPVKLIRKYTSKNYLDLYQAKLGLISDSNWCNLQKYFIISTGRTGTNTLAKVLNSQQNSYSIHEPFPDLYDLGKKYAEKKIKTKSAVNQFKKYRRVVLKDIMNKNIEFKYYIESNNRLFSLIPIIKEVFPNSGIIHIVRDGRDVVRSGMSRSWYTKNDNFNRLKATEFENDRLKDRWSTLTRFEKVCWWWYKKDSIIYENLKNFSKSITVNFSRIFNEKEGYQGLKEIIDFIGLDIAIEELEIKKYNKSKSYDIDDWRNWSDEKLNQFDQIAGDHMRNYSFFNY